VRRPMTDRTTTAPSTTTPTARDDPPGVTWDLDRVFAEVAALRALDADDDRDQARVYDASIRWGTLLAGRLQRLALLHDRGALAGDDRSRFEELSTALRDLEPVLDRLGLPRGPRARHR
jgi:hypothetical protein